MWKVEGNFQKVYSTENKIGTILSEIHRVKEKVQRPRIKQKKNGPTAKALLLHGRYGDVSSKEARELLEGSEFLRKSSERKQGERKDSMPRLSPW